MRLSLFYIEADDVLYRGYGRLYPAIIWNAPERAWQTYSGDTPKSQNWGCVLSPVEADRCYPGSTTAPLPDGVLPERDIIGDELVVLRPDLFDDYNPEPYRCSPKERAASHARMQQGIEERLAASPVLQKRRLLMTEGGEIFRGPALTMPREILVNGAWEPYRGGNQPDGLGRLVTQQEAERIAGCSIPRDEENSG